MSESGLPLDVRQRAQAQDWPAMPRVEIIDLQALQGLQGLLELAAIRATAHQDRTAIKRDEGISADQFVAEGVVEAQAFRRMSRTGNHAPIGVSRQTMHIFDPYIYQLCLVLVIGWEIIEVMQ